MNVPARTRVAIVGHDDTVNEVVNFDHTYDLVRDCKFMNFGMPAEVSVGWKFINYRWVPPEPKGDKK